MIARKRNAKKGFATAITNMIMLVAVVSMGSLVLLSANTNFFAKSNTATDTFTAGANTVKENFIVEDVRFSGSSSSPTSTGNGRIVYALLGDNTAKTKPWTGSTTTWGATEQSTGITESTDIAFVITRASPSGSKFLSLSATTLDSSVRVKHFDGSTWTAGGWSQNVVVWSSTQKIKAFDIAYEQLSGQAIAVYRYSTDADHPHYRVWDGSSWGADQALPNVKLDASDDAVEWIKLASKPGSNKIALAWSDATDRLHAMIWDGDNNAWLSSSEIGPGDSNAISGLNTGNLLKFDLAYEHGGSGKLLVVASRSTASNQLRYLTWDGSTWSTVGAATLASSITVRQVGVAPNFSSNNIFAAFCDTGQIWGAIWDGSSITNAQNLESIASCMDWQASSGNNFAISALGTTGKAVILYDNAPSVVDWALWSGSAWSVADYSPGVALATERGFDLDSENGFNKVIATISDNTGNLWGFIYDGTSWSQTTNGSPIKIPILTFTKPFDFALEFSTGSSNPKQISMAVTNVGKISVTIQKIYLDNNLVWSGSTVITPKKSATITFTFEWQSGSYEAKIETSRSNVQITTWKAP